MSNPESSYAFKPVPAIYDEVMGPVYFEAYAQETARRVASWHPASVLETACGTGIVTAHLRKYLDPKTKLTASDINGDMLAYAKKKEEGLGDIAWLEADAMQLPFPDASFDAAVCQFGAMFFTDKHQGFSEAYRVLNPGGKYALAVWDKLDVNPLGAAGREVLLDFFEGRPPENLRTAFSMADKAMVSGLLAEAGFLDITAEAINKPCETESAELFAAAFVHGSSVREAIVSCTTEAIDALQRKISDAIIRKFGNHPVKSTMQAILFTASKKSP